jgi:hypothetical protein
MTGQHLAGSHLTLHLQIFVCYDTDALLFAPPVLPFCPALQELHTDVQALNQGRNLEWKRAACGALLDPQR